MGLSAAITAALSDDLRRAPWRGCPNREEGHCYVAAEALFHLLGGKAAGWTPATLYHEDGVHWFLRHRDGRIADPTVGQFNTLPDYAHGRGRGFLTRAPSRRAAELMRRVGGGR